MRLKNTKIDVLQKINKKDNIGGYVEEFEVIKSIYVDLFNMRTDKQLNSFGEISKTALTIICNTKIKNDCFIKFEDRIYKIISNNKVFKRFTYDLEVIENADDR